MGLSVPFCGATLTCLEMLSEFGVQGNERFFEAVAKRIQCIPQIKALRLVTFTFLKGSSFIWVRPGSPRYYRT